MEGEDIHIDFDLLNDAEERRVLYAALDSFRQYRQAAHYNITHLRRKSFYSLPSAHVDILSEPPFNLPQTFRDVDDAIDSNADISDAILQTGLQSFGLDPEDSSWKGKATPNDMDKARSTIRQLYRDWSAEGLDERKAVFDLIQEALATLGPLEEADRHRVRILVPGAGLGRLVLELCTQGYTAEGNEISYHQLLASNYILNCTHKVGQHRLYPWALAFSNHLTRANQLRAVEVPDVHPATAMALMNSSLDGSERMSMSAGDFCSLYRQPDYQDTFDAVTTCFFIDTAPNVINYIESIRNCLKTGGLWINAGPLLWHFASAPTPAEKKRQRKESGELEDQMDDSGGINDPGSFELSEDEVVALVGKLGLDILEHTPRLETPTGYIHDPESMLQNIYRPSFWVAKKR